MRLGRFSFFIVVLIFLSVSFVPLPFIQRYHVGLTSALSVVFLTLSFLSRFSFFRKEDFPVWFFIAALGINVFFAQYREEALRTYLCLALPLISVYYISRLAFRERRFFYIFAKIISTASILVCALAVFEAVFAINPIYEYWLKNCFYERYITGFVRPMSTQFNPGPLGCYLLACLPFNFMLFRRDKGFFKWTGAIGMVLNTVVIILTFSRGVFAGLLAMGVFYLIVQKKYRLAIMATVGLTLVFIMCFSLPYPFSRFSLGATLGEGGLLSRYRLDRVTMALNMTKDYPLTGIGFQHFRSRFYEYYPWKYEIPWEIRIADNMYLTLLAEAGIIAFLAFLAFVLSFLRRGWKKLSILKEPSYERWGLLASMMAFIGLLFSMVGYEFMYWPNQYLLFCIITGCLGSFFKREQA